MRLAASHDGRQLFPARSLSAGASVSIPVQCRSFAGNSRGEKLLWNSGPHETLARSVPFQRLVSEVASCHGMLALQYSLKLALHRVVFLFESNTSEHTHTHTHTHMVLAKNVTLVCLSLENKTLDSRLGINFKVRQAKNGACCAGTSLAELTVLQPRRLR